MKEIEEGWCKKATKITMITISPNNSNFLYYDDQFLLGKLNQKTANFDVLLFSRRDLEKVTIPSNLKRIGSYSFDECKKLKKIEFQSNSNLQSIGKKALCFNNSIENIKIPSTVYLIEESAFLCCKKLKSVELKEDSLLSKICEKSTAIEKIFIPSKVTEIGNEAFYACYLFKSIEFSDDSKLEIIKNNAFRLTSIKNILFPSNVTEISDEIFASCFFLEKVEFSKESKLKKIGKYAFASCPIRKIIIPSTVEKICEKAFSECFCLKSIEFESNSKLQLFESQLFCNCFIQSITIPSELKELKEGWCCRIKELTNIFVPPENKHFKFIEKSDKFDILFFANRGIEHAAIPSFIKKINSFAFSECEKLKFIEFTENSELISIENNGFSYSSIEKIFIPSTVNRIGEFAFSNCGNLHKIDNYENTQINSIEKESLPSLNFLSIPSNVNELKNGWCRCIQDLNQIIVSPNNKHFSLVENKFLFGKSDEKVTILTLFILLIVALIKLLFHHLLKELVHMHFFVVN